MSQQQENPGSTYFLSGRPPGRGIFYGWWVLLALSATIFYIAGSFWWGFSVFFPEILREFGWSRATASLALTLQSLESSAAAPLFGYLVGRVPVRRLMLFGFLVAGLGIVLLSQTHSLWWFYGSFLLIAVGTGACAGVVAQTLVVRWFYRRSGRATTVLFVMPGLGASLLIPFLTFAIDAIGWRQSLLLIGIGFGLLAVPVLLLVRDSPESLGLRPDGARPPVAKEPADAQKLTLADERSFTLREAIRQRTFWLLAVAIAFWNLASSGVQPHLFVALLGISIPRGQAALIVALLPAVSLVGRIGFGLLSDFIDKRLLLATAVATEAIGLAFLTALMLRPQDTSLTFAFLAFFAVGFGGLIPTQMVTVGNYFGRHHFGIVFGALGAVSTWGGMIGPFFAGWVFDVTGSYFGAYATGCVLLVLAVPLFLAARNPQPSARVVSPAPAGPRSIGSVGMARWTARFMRPLKK
ncbi:MAG: MFS transporter [Chloroflexi bacterium]|nr:MFS transporter [Chloroflexota bacterium]